MKSLQEYIKENEDMRGIVTNAADVVQGLKDISNELAQLQKRYFEATGEQTTDFLHFKSMVDEIVSTDNGEAGLEPFIDALFQETAASDVAEEQWSSRDKYKKKSKNSGYSSRSYTNVDDDETQEREQRRNDKIYNNPNDPKRR